MMAAKKVASALSLLTSDGFETCQDWPDNCAAEALIAEYFTRCGNDVESEESSDDDHNGMLMNNSAIYSLQDLFYIDENATRDSTDMEATTQEECNDSEEVVKIIFIRHCRINTIKI